MTALFCALWIIWIGFSLIYVAAFFKIETICAAIVRTFGTVAMVVALWQFNLVWFVGLTVGTIVLEELAVRMLDKKRLESSKLGNFLLGGFINLLGNVILFGLIQLVAGQITNPLSP